MAANAEARAAVVAEPDRRLANAAIPCQPKHAGNDLPKSVYSDLRREILGFETPAARLRAVFH